MLLAGPPCLDAFGQHEFPTHHDALDGAGIPYVLERVRGEDEKVSGPPRHENPERIGRQDSSVPRCGGHERLHGGESGSYQQL